MLSCTGTQGFAVPGGLLVPLTLDACTTAGLALHHALSGRVDIDGNATTPTITLPSLPPGITIYSAALLLGPSALPKAVTDPIWFTTR